MILDQHGHVLVSNEPVTSVELAPSGLATELRAPGARDSRAGTRRRGLGPPHHEAARRAPDRRRHARPRRRPHQGDGTDADYLEERSGDFPGLVLARSYIRRYPDGSVAAQLLGYDGQNTHSAGAVIGLTGIEAAFDRFLRGVPGVARVRVDSLGRPQSPRLLTTPPVDGPDGAAHDRQQAAGRGPERAPRTGSRSRATRASGRPTAARSSRSTRRTGRSSRSPPRPRTTRRSTADA